MNQKEIDKKLFELNHHRAALHAELGVIYNKTRELYAAARELEDPYALIPKQYKTLEEWLNGHPFPQSVLSMVFRNRTEAEDVQRSCNTYTFDYHVVKYSPEK